MSDSWHPMMPNPTTATSTNTTVWFGHSMPPPTSAPTGPLSRLQFWLQHRRFPLWWFGNRVSDIRYWLWRLCR